MERGSGASRPGATERDPQRVVGRLGLGSGVLAAVWSIWFIVAFAPWMAALGEWPGIEAYAARFETLPYLAWVVPCLLLALTFPVFLAVVHASAPAERRVWSLIALVFGAMYGGVLTTNYWVVGSAVRGALEAGELDGLAWFAIGNPYSVTGALEGIGYAFMGIAAVFVGFAFAGAWTRRMFVANGVAGLLGFGAIVLIDVLPDWLGFVGWGALAAWNITFPIALVLGGLSLWRSARGADKQAVSGSGQPVLRPE